MNSTAPWAWSGSRRSFRRRGPEEGKSSAAAMGRKTLNVRGSGEASWGLAGCCSGLGAWGGERLGAGQLERGRPDPLAASAPVPADHRQSSHHIHHPLSTHLPPDTRRRKTPQGPGRKPRRRPGASPTGETPTIEEGEEEEDEASEAEGSRALSQPSPASTPSSVQVSGAGPPRGRGTVCRISGPASPAHTASLF